MKQINKQTFKSASFVMAGGACLIGLIGHYLRIDGPLHVRGIQFLTSLVIPALCFWVGMLIRYKVGKPKCWVVAIAAALMVASYCYSFYALSHFTWENIFYQWLGLILLGFLLPWDYLYQHRDPDGIKSGILLMISALVFGALELVNGRMMTVDMPSPVDDLGALLSSVSLFILPLATIVPVYFAAEFSLSKAGQWLGEKKWYRWVIGIAAVYSFLMTITGMMFFPRWDVQMWLLTRLLVLPFSIYLIIVISRIIRKMGKKELTWKEVFAI